MNNVHIAGHLGADPEVRFTSGGQKATTIRLAARVRRGANNEDTIWWRVTVWGEQFDKMMPYLKKGSPLYVIGDMSKPEIFNDREGKPQISMNLTAIRLQFSPFGKSSDRSQQDQQQQSSGQGSSGQEFAGNAQGGMGQGQQQQQQNDSFSQDDEVPF